MKLIRNAGKVLSQLIDLPGQPIKTKVDLMIHVPTRFSEVGLASVGSTVQIFGLFAIILKTGEYALCNVNALVEIKPSLIEKVTIDDVEYYQFQFLAGDTVIQSKDLVCRSSLIFSAIEEFVFKGKIPYYVGYEDMGKLFDTAKEHARTSANIHPAVMEFMAAYIARNRKNPTKFIRQMAKTEADFESSDLMWVPLRSVYFSAPSTVNKLSGAYFDNGVVSALVQKNERSEKIENILRS